MLRSQHPTTATKPIVLLVGTVMLIVTLIGLPHLSAQEETADPELVRVVQQTVSAQHHITDAEQILVANITSTGGWAFGTAAIPTNEADHPRPELYLFLAQQNQQRWTVTLESDAAFREWMERAPRRLVSPAEREILTAEPVAQISQGPGIAHAGAAQLSLPWATGETWFLTGGPHGNVLEALDFAGGSGLVRAARDGIAYVPCANMVMVYHPDGWRTGYYHLANISVGNGQPVARGTPLGQISNGVGCGGYSTGPHVHFWTQIGTAYQPIQGQTIGGWTARNGAAQYQGCLVRNGVTRCAPSQIFNDGTIGSGGTRSIFDYNGDGRPDLYAINRNRSGVAEIHVVNGADTFQSFLTQTDTPLDGIDANGEWVFLLGDYNGDGKPDVYAIRKQNTGTKSTEVHVLNGADNFQSFLLRTGTAKHETGTNGQWAFALGDYNGDGRPDLYAINRAQTGTRSTEVHILNGANNFQSFLLHAGTVLPETGTNGQWAFAVGDYNGNGRADLYAINRGGNNTTEVQVLNGADNYQSFLTQTATKLPATGNDGRWAFILGDHNGDGRNDLYAISREGRDSSEINILNGADNFQSFLVQSATVLPRTGSDCAWSFPNGQCVASPPPPPTPLPTDLPFHVYLPYTNN